MPYIGKNPVGGGFHKLDALTASATDTYALTLGSAAYFPETANQLLVSLNGVIQAPQDSFTVSGSNLVFDTALTASDSIDFVVALGDVLAVQTVTDGAITTAKLGNGAVTSAKLDTNIAVSGNLDVGTIRDAAGTNTAMTIDSTGRVLTPARPAFSATASTSFNITSGTISYDSEQFDIGGNYNASTYKFTCPVAGIYSFSFSYYAVNTTTSRGSLYKNTSLYAIGNRVETNGNHPSTTSTIVMQCSVNDEIYVGWQEGSVHIAPAYNHFSGYLIG